LRVLAGAALLGTVIHAINHDRRERVVHRTQRVSPRRAGHFILDEQGQCVEVTTNSRGQEVWTYVDSSYCY
jgi:hypothetical protein